MRVLVTFTVLVLACATPYQRAGYAGGYSETRLAEDRWIVDFWGNGYTSGARVRDFTLLRAAELTLDNGFRYFAILEAEASVDTSVTGDADGVRTVQRPRSGIVITCFRERPSAVDALDAVFVSRSIRAKYEITPVPRSAASASSSGPRE